MNADEIVRALRLNNRKSGWNDIDRLMDVAADLIESLKAQRDNAVAGEKSVLARFRHLLKSDFIAAFDEWDPHKNYYARDISEADEISTSLEAYSAAARSIAVSLNDYCDRSLPYDQMISDAARKAVAEIESLQAMLDAAIAGQETLQMALAESQRRERAAVSDIEEMMGQDFESDKCWACTPDFNCGEARRCIPKWRGPQAGEESREMNKGKDVIE